jgi:hypothetical protein
MPEENHEAEHAAVAVEEEPAQEEEPYEEQADLSAMRARLAASRKSSMLVPTLMIFLVPYALCTTAFIAYLLWLWPTIERLDYLPDPNMLKKAAGEKKATSINLPAHRSELAQNRMIPLGSTVQVGFIEVTPIQVKRIGAGELELEFVAKNLSPDPMIPIEPEFWATSGGSFRPYTFLDCNKRDETIDNKEGGGYGGFLEFFDVDAAGKERARSRSELQPGTEEHIRLVTDLKSRKYLERIKGDDTRYVWRLQLRRGNIRYRGGDIPATCVIGVKFNESEIKPKS